MDNRTNRRRRDQTRRADATQLERGPVPRRRKAKVALALFGVFAGILLGSALVAWWLLFERADLPGVAGGVPVQVEITEGASTAQIAERLSAAGVVANANRFRLESRLAGADGMLRAGVYDLVTGLTYDEAIIELRDGPSIVYTSLTIPEGFVIEQIAQRVEEKTGISAEEFTVLANSGQAQFPREFLSDVHQGSLEGYLFPKTYRIPKGATAHDVINMMLDQFEIEIAQVDLSAAQARGFSQHEIMTLASMIERETRVADERVMVSSVIHNRLEIGMRLEIDATVEYVLPGNRFRLLYEDLEVDSPFNTYRHFGLPPGPIASPGLASIEAAAHPAETDYLYYVLVDPDGSHSFTTTLQDHLRERERSREVFGR